MAEIKSPHENTCSARLSQEEIQMPLSPVLSTGQSLKKLIKNRKERHKRNTNKVAQKLENIMIPQDETDKKRSNSVQLEDSLPVFNEEDSMLEDFKLLEANTSNAGDIPGQSKPGLFVECNPHDMPGNLSDRIQILEELQTKKSDVIKAISFRNTVDISVSTFKPIPAVITNQPGKVNIENDLKVGKKELFHTNCKEEGTDLKEVNTTVSFQTGTGKDIAIPETSIKQSLRLFDDILYPSNSQCSRKKKFSYLSKYKSPDKYAAKISQAETGFLRKCEVSCVSSVGPSKNSISSLVIAGSAQTKNEEKNCRNIFEDENFDDLKLFQDIGFIEASASLKDKHFHKGIQAEPQKMIQDKPANVMPQNYVPKPITKKSCGNIFESENFDDLRLLKNVGFKAASISLKDKQNKEFPAEPHKMIQEKPANVVPQNDVSKPITKRSCRNIFESENFDDLRLLQNIGFKAALVSLKGKQVHKEFSTEPQKMIQEKPANVVQQNNVPESTKKSCTNIFEEENFDDLKVLGKCGFQLSTASLENISSANSDKKSLKNIFEGENFGDLTMTENIGFRPASLSLSNRTEANKKPARQGIHDNMEFDGLNNQPQSSSSKGVILPQEDRQESLPKKPCRNIFEGENLADFQVNLSDVKVLKSNTNSNALKVDSKPKVFRNIFEGENFDDLNLSGLGPKFQSPLTNLKKNHLQNRNPYRTPNKNIGIQSDGNFLGFSKEEKNIFLNISNSFCDILKITENRFMTNISQNNPEKALLVNLSNIANLTKKLYSDKLKSSVELDLANHNRKLDRKRKFSELDSDHNSLCQKPETEPLLQKSFLKRPRKRLGCHFSPTIQISETVLKRAKLLFEDIGCRPVETSTPNKLNGSLAAPLVCHLTPVQTVRKNLGSSFLDAAKTGCGFSRSFSLDQTLTKTVRFGLNKPSDGDVKVWMENLSSERMCLEEMLRVVAEKQTILSNQKTILDFSAIGRTRIVPGVLYNSKKRKDRISLKDLLASIQSEENSTISFLNQINPQNAHLIHFYIENIRQSHIQTQDGATIVSTRDGRIGISEIEHSFKVIEGVDPHLIPNGWIHNHYKWIIWKLASYERIFSDRFEGCLCVENVIQQLKYRYDIEIDQAKRSVLHKIFEKDDCPQRRLVLCVSKILKIDNKYELELTDGWYPIRTIIDPLLCDQIAKGKLKLGVKLMTYGADLMNCDGCHPLEAIEQIHLKINYNATRRAAWWSRLGCQKESGPFLIPLSSINMEGGKIGCIKCFVSRVYPVKYMEKCGDTNVWRNRKAEERREQEFQNERIRVLEEKPCRSNFKSKNTSKKDVLKSIRNVDDPELLYDIMQKSTDPEMIYENLTCSQKTLLSNYSIHKSAYSKPISKFNDGAALVQERCVTSLLKIKIIDASRDCNVAYDFHVWRPQDSHLQELKEGEVMTICNVSCSAKWGLSANRLTQFKKEEKARDERYQKFRRKVTLIEELQSFCVDNQVLTEFDTVGIVVKKIISEHQEIWLSDKRGNLLLIKIFDSPKNILVLDAVNEGQFVAVCNLIFKHSSREYSFVVADHFVVFSRYSQYRHLQEATARLEEDMRAEDLSSLLQDCKRRVDEIVKRDFSSSKLAWDMDDMDCSQITTTDLALLECVEKLT